MKATSNFCGKSLDQLNVTKLGEKFSVVNPINITRVDSERRKALGGKIVYLENKIMENVDVTSGIRQGCNGSNTQMINYSNHRKR